jgi:stress up-regulated protein Nod 19
MQAIKRLALLVCALTLFAVPATANAAITTKTIDYGPYTIPAGGGDPHDHHSMGMIANQIVQNIAKPCTGCSIIGVTPDLVYTDGSKANITEGPMLHHAMFSAQSSGKSDVTCGSSGPGILGERFFASGNERTPVDLTSLPYGYKVNSSETWNMVFDLMNWQTTSKTVKIRMTWKYATGTDHTSRAALRPVWLDVAQCTLNSYYSPPFGVSDTHYDWKASFGGKLIAAAGHIHDHGVNIEVTNETKKTLLCNSVATTGGTGYVTHSDGRKHVSGMNVCTGNPISTIAKGDTIRLHSIYNIPEGHHAIEDAMGIAIAYINPS